MRSPEKSGENSVLPGRNGAKNGLRCGLHSRETPRTNVFGGISDGCQNKSPSHRSADIDLGPCKQGGELDDLRIWNGFSAFVWPIDALRAKGESWFLPPFALQSDENEGALPVDNQDRPYDVAVNRNLSLPKNKTLPPCSRASASRSSETLLRANTSACTESHPQMVRLFLSCPGP